MDGISKTRLYTIFSNMKQRCYNPNCNTYRFYGAKGITICDEWMSEHGLLSFTEWALNNGYEEHLTIDRIDPKGSYSPENCQWITRSENSKRVERELSYKLIPGPGIKYYKLFVLMNEKGLTTYRIRKEKIISEGTLQKLREGKAVSTDSIASLCAALGCQPGDIMEYVDETEGRT